MIKLILQNISNLKSNKNIAFLVLLYIVSLCNINTVFANTGVNPQIPYSGTVVKNDGTVLDGTSFQAKFIIYNSQALSDLANIIHQEIRTIEIRDGKFEVLLGETTPIDISKLNDDSLWLELQLNIDLISPDYEEIFSPRRRIGSALSAINSMRLVANGGTDTDTLSLDVAGNVIATSLGGGANTTTPAGFDRVLLANISGQFSQVSLSSLTSGNLTTTTGWALAGNSTTDAWNGTTGSRLGTTNALPLVLATTNASAQDIRFFTGNNGANERMRITGAGGLLYVGSTTGPTAQLNVISQLASRIGLVIRGAASQTANIMELQNSAGSTLLSANNNGSLLLNPFGTAAGNTNELRFAELAANGTNYIGLKAADNVGTTNAVYTLPSATPTVNGQVLSSTTGGLMSWISAGSGSGWGLTGNSGTNPTSNYIGTSDAQALSIRTNAVERMRILTDNTVVVGTGEGTITDGGTIPTVTLRAPSVGVTPNWVGGSTLNISGGAGTGAYPGGAITFTTTASNASNLLERMRITPNGNVGIGTNAPSNRLEVLGTVGLNISGIASTTIGNTVGNTAVTINTSSTGRLVLGGLPVQTSTSDDVMLINGSNQVSRITIANLVNTSGWGLTGNSGTNPTSNYIGTSDAQALSIRTNAVERMRILTDNTVVVGTGEGTITDGGTIPTVTLRAPSVGVTPNWVGGSTLNISGGAGTGAYPGGAITFTTTASNASNLLERMRITPNGNVGIGDTTPANLFTVGNGDLFQINSSGAIVAVTGITTTGGYTQTGTGVNTFTGTTNINTTGSNLTNIGRVVLSAGTATANTAPLKFTSGTNLTTPEAGAVEWNGTNLFLTTSGGVRQTINQGLTATATLDFASTNNADYIDLTVTVTGANLNDVVSLGIPNGSVPAANSNFTAWVSAANTVTVRFNNNSGVAQDPASGSFKVFVTKF